MQFIVATVITGGLITDQSDSVITGGEAGLKCLPDGKAPRFGNFRVIAPEVGDPVGDLEQGPGSVRAGLHAKRYDQAFGIATGSDQTGQCRQRIGAGRILRLGKAVDLPLGDQAIGRNTRVKGVSSLAVHIIDVPMGPSAQAGKIKVGVSCLERIEGPGDQAKALGMGHIRAERS